VPINDVAITPADWDLLVKVGMNRRSAQSAVRTY
jgi:hypothetical protein